MGRAAPLDGQGGITLKKITFCALALLLLLGITPRSAQAQETESPLAAKPAAAPPPASGGPRVWPPHRDRERGLVLNGGFGVSGCNDNICDNFDPLVYFRIQGLFRVINFLAVGLHFALPFHDANSSLVDARYDVFLGPEIRGILPLWRFEFWTAISLGWFRAQADGEGCIGAWCAEGSIYSDGFGFGWGFGIQFYITKAIAAGLAFWIYKPYLVEGCTDIEGYDTECDDIDNQDDVGITWTFGATFTYFIPL
jgi:hypothetical protein